MSSRTYRFGIWPSKTEDSPNKQRMLRTWIRWETINTIRRFGHHSSRRCCIPRSCQIRPPSAPTWYWKHQYRIRAGTFAHIWLENHSLRWIHRIPPISTASCSNGTQSIPIQAKSSQKLIIYAGRDRFDYVDLLTSDTWCTFSSSTKLYLMSTLMYRAEYSILNMNIFIWSS